MARPIDPQRHRARRLHIIDAALTVFAHHGFDGATTSAICRQAGIGSGTLFHYFNTKVDILLAILAEGTRETQEFATSLAGADPIEALERIIDREVAESTDPRVPGFVQAVAGMMNRGQISVALAADEAAQRRLVGTWVEHAARQQRIRTDISTDRITSWLLLFFNGFVERVSVDSMFSIEAEQDLLRQTIFSFLRGHSQPLA